MKRLFIKMLQTNWGKKIATQLIEAFIDFAVKKFAEKLGEEKIPTLIGNAVKGITIKEFIDDDYYKKIGLEK